MMFVFHRKHTYGLPLPVTETALLFGFFVSVVSSRVTISRIKLKLDLKKFPHSLDVSAMPIVPHPEQ
jgi:hypothetical protein